MNTFVAILSQFAWALTVGGLVAALTALGQIAGLAACALAGGSCALWAWRKHRARKGK